jgi:membrane protease subunit HflK
MVQEAQGFRDSQIARARGEAGRFNAVLGAYNTAQDVTVRRMYLETMEEIFKRNGMILVDDRLQGLVPFLPLGEQRSNAPASQPAPRPAVPPAAVAPMIQQQRGGTGR